MELKKALELRKAKYLKRTGGPGRYKYQYKEEAGRRKPKGLVGKKGEKYKTLADEQKDYLEKKGLSKEYVEKVRMRDLLKVAEMVEAGHMDIKDVRSAIDNNDVLQRYEEYSEGKGKKKKIVEG